jgi:hypothetical protein
MNDSPGSAQADVFDGDKSDHHKHMDFVQAIISRLANNSFLMKGWSLTLSSATLGFAVTQKNPVLALAAVIPALAFWILDSYFLRQERAFRKMFKEVVAKNVPAFEIEPTKYVESIKRRSVFFSVSLFSFYGAILGLCLVVAFSLSLSRSPDSPDVAPAPSSATPAVQSPVPEVPSEIGQEPLGPQPPATPAQ